MTEANKIIYSMMNVSKYHNKKQVLRDINLSYFYGAKIGVLGLNGAGKSTLLRILAGADKDFDGKVSLQPGYRIGYLEQEPKLTAGQTVKEAIEEGLVEVMGLMKEYDEINEKFAEEMTADEMDALLDRQGKVQDKLEALDAWNLDTRIDMAMTALQCPPAETVVDQLSGGEKRRVALCRLLMSAPDILLLDEPTNHLDAETVNWLEQFLARYEGTVIAVTHDRYFLDNVAGWILELDYGQGIPWKGNYSSWLDQKRRRLEVEEKQETKRQRALKRELEWINKSPQARQSKNKARIANYEQMLSEDVTKRDKDVEIFIPAGPRLGDQVIIAKGVAKAFGEHVLYENLNFELPPGGIVGIIGPNGVGKTTLFKMILGQESPDKGDFIIGETVQIAHAEQSRDALQDDMPVWSAISDGEELFMLGKQEVKARSYAARFNFTGSDQQKPVGVLSGGERNRVHLARMLKSGANVLLFDEPTNDLDVNTMRALEEAILDFAGCVVVISHDRWFLDRVATHILAFEPDGPHWHVGNFESYESRRKERLGDSDEKAKYRKLAK